MPMSNANRNHRARLMMKLPRKSDLKNIADEPSKSTRELTDETDLTTRQAARLLAGMEMEYQAVHSTLCKVGARNIRLWWQHTRTSVDRQR